MAFYDDNDDENLEGQGAGQPVSTGAQSSSITGQTAAQTPSQSSAKPDNPGNFVNLKQYLDANKTQAEKLGTQTAGLVQQVNTQAGTAQQGLVSQAQQDINQGQALSQDVSNAIQNNAETLTQEQRDQAKQIASQTYGGPTDYTGLGTAYTQALSDTNKAKEANEATKTEQGRMGLVTQLNEAPRTQGINVFDNALLQSGTGRQQLANVAQQNANVGQNLTDIQNQITGDIASAKDLTQQRQQEAYNTIQNALSAWKTGFTPKVSEAQQNLTNTQNAVYTDLGNGQLQLSPQTAALLGLAPGTRIYAADLKSYLTQASPTDITAANVASAEDYARYAALADLAGDTDNILDQANVGQAGTAQLAPGVNTTKLQQDIAASDAAYQQKYTQVPLAVPSSLPSSNGANNDIRFRDPSGPRDPAGNLLGDIVNQTPWDLENRWLPALTNPNYQYSTVNSPYYRTLVADIQRALAQFKANNYYNNVVNVQ